MSLKVKIMASVLSFLSFAFSCIGYAALTTDININAYYTVSQPKELFITEIKSVSGSTVPPTYEIVPNTAVQSTITLGSSGTDTVTMVITVKNNTNTPYGFDSSIYTSAAYSNANIVYDTTLERKTIKDGEETGTKILPGEIFDFTVTFSHKDETVGENLELKSLINYQFLPWDSIQPDIIDTTIVADDVMGRFEEILTSLDHMEDVTDENGNTVTAKEYLEDSMANTPGGWFGRNDSYIANFSDADEADKNAIATLFGEKLELVINGEKVEVKIIIKRQDVTGDGVEDYTMYMTTHSLEQSDGRREEDGTGWFGTTQYKYIAAPIYATVYKGETVEDGSTTYSKFGEMFAGEGEIVRYNGTSGSGSFNTDTWVTTQAYGAAPSGSDIERVVSEYTAQTP